MRKTKIVCTIGPSTDSVEMIEKLILTGMNTSRHNFSHGDHEEHKKRIDKVKSISSKLGVTVAVLLDTKGPEIRTIDFKNGSAELISGNKFNIHCGKEILGDENGCSITYKDLYKDVIKGNHILIDDGLIDLIVEKVNGYIIECIIINSGKVSNHKGINVPGVEVSIPALTDKDVDDLIFGCEMGVDFIAASFIRKEEDVLHIRRVLDENGGGDIKIISKIENQEGVNNVDRILKYSDGIMVARGDLGVEIPIEVVPSVQKMIISKCNAVGKIVITATQMLDSMSKNPRPTRAEASDVANAIYDGTDAIMLSGETANGKYPIEAVKTMSHIAMATEENLDYEDILKKHRKQLVPNVPNSIAIATVNSSSDLNASAIITATQTGYSAKKVSRYKPKSPIIAVTPYEQIARSLALCWGVFPMVIPEIFVTTDDLINKSTDFVLKQGYVKPGDIVVIAAGIPISYAGSTNMMKIHVVGDVLIKGKGAGKIQAFGNIVIPSNATDALNKLEIGQEDVIVLKDLDESYIPLFDQMEALIVESEVSPEIMIAAKKHDVALIHSAKDACLILKEGCFVTLDSKSGVVFSGRANIY